MASYPIIRALTPNAPFCGHLEWPEQQLALSAPDSRLRVYDASAAEPRLLDVVFHDWRGR